MVWGIVIPWALPAHLHVPSARAVNRAAATRAISDVLITILGRLHLVFGSMRRASGLVILIYVTGGFRSVTITIIINNLIYSIIILAVTVM